MGMTIEQADYENRLKADMVAMLTEIQLEIEELNVNKLGNNDVDKCSNIYIGVNCCKRILASKINSLKENT